MWRLQNDMTPISRVSVKRDDSDDQAVYTEMTVEVRPEPTTTGAATLRR